MSVIVSNNNRYTVDPLYQWDINQTLEIYGLTLKSLPEIHFTIPSMSCAIVVRPTVGKDGVITADIPNSLLQKSEPITVLICELEGSSFKTSYKIIVPVKARKKPGDYSISINDTEVYSFYKMSQRLDIIEEKVGSDDTYIDKVKPLIFANTDLANEALSIAKGKNQARVFGTTTDLEEWLSNSENAGKCVVGDNLYIIDVDVPDWWISEVLDSKDPTTGYYYRIAQLETQKVDLTDIYNRISTLENNLITLEDNLKPVTLWTNPDTEANFDAQTIELDLTAYNQIIILFKDMEKTFNFKDHNYRVMTHSKNSATIDYRKVEITDTGVIFGPLDTSSSSPTAYDREYLTPYKIIGRKI